MYEDEGAGVMDVVARRRNFREAKRSFNRGAIDP